MARITPSPAVPPVVAVWRLVVVALAIAMLLGTIAGALTMPVAAQDATVTAAAAQATEPPVSEPTAPPTPTETPAPAPTEVPVEPTAPPVEPTVPPVEPTATATPPPSPTPAPTPSPTPRVRTAMVVEQPNPGALSCTEPNGDRVSPGGTITYQCAFNVTYANQGTMETIFTGSITAGWSVSITGTFGGATYAAPFASPRVELRVPAKGSLSGSLTVSVRAPANAAGGATGTLSLTTTCTNSSACAAAALRPSAQIVTTVHDKPCSSVPGAIVTASLSGATLPPVSYAYAGRTNTGSATLQVTNPSQCSGWSVSISGTDLRYSGAAPNQAPIPVGNLRVTAPGKAALPLSTQAKPLVTGGGNNASYSWPLTISLDIPGGSPAGTYTGTITINTTSAP